MYLAEREAAPRPEHVTAHAPKQRLTEWLALLFTLAVVTAVCFGQSTMKLFWYDELVTIRIASFHTFGQIWNFYQSGKDTTSFLPAMLIHLFQHLPGRPELTLRIPFTFAYVVACLCLWIFVRRRYPVGYAMSAMLFLPQGYSLYFASETRAYAFVLMGAAIAMVCWQSANRGGRFSGLATFGVFFGLSTAILFHFFAIFLFVPFAIAEWFHQRRSGYVRWTMWLAIVLFPASLIVMLPNMLAARHIYGGTFWSKPAVGDYTDCYGFFMLPLGRGLAEIVILFAAVLWYQRRRRQPGADDLVATTSGFTQAEWVLLVSVSLLPIVAFLGSLLLGLFRTQYVLYFQLGLTLAFVGGSAEIFKRRASAGWAFGLIMLLLLVVHVRGSLIQGFHELTGKPYITNPTEYQADWFDFIRPMPLPVVADGSLVLLPVMQYAPPELQQRLSLLTSYRRALTEPGAVTNELNMEVFGRSLNLPIQDYDQFTAAHHDFLLVVSQQWLDHTWLYRYLVHESETKRDVQLKLVWASDPVGATAQIYEVHFRPPAPANSAP